MHSLVNFKSNTKTQLFKGIVRAQIQTKPDDDDETLLLPKGRPTPPPPPQQQQETNSTQKLNTGTTGGLYCSFFLRDYILINVCFLTLQNVV